MDSSIDTCGMNYSLKYVYAYKYVEYPASTIIIIRTYLLLILLFCMHIFRVLEVVYSRL